jgi:preprotein translocase subunit YajC
MKSWLGSFCLSCALIGAPSVAVAAAQPTIATAKPISGSNTAAPAAPAAATPAPTAQATVQSAAAKAATAAPTTGPATAATSQPAQPPETLTSEIMSFAPLALMLIVVFFFMSSGRKREQKKRDQMYNALKRGSRVVTAGGLIASVVEVRDDEVVLKVDEANNIKERYTKSAIIKVLDEGDAAPDKV